ncbi:DoxX family membrane protein [Mycobacterium sp. NPDC003323]
MTATPDRRLLRAATVFARLALASAFLSAVADRFGLWGPAGTPHVAWGHFDAFVDTVAVFAPYLPDPLVPAAAWAATIVEVLLAVALLLGVALRWTAAASAATLMVFGLSMLFFWGAETPFSASVFTAAAAAALLAVAPDDSHALRLGR